MFGLGLDKFYFRLTKFLNQILVKASQITLGIREFEEKNVVWKKVRWTVNQKIVLLIL